MTSLRKLSSAKKAARVRRSSMSTGKKASAVKAATKKVKAKARVDFVETVRK